MKYFAGIFRLPATWAELGKNAPSAPSPSLSMLSGATKGFLMMYCLLHERRAYTEPKATTRAAAAIATADAQPALRSCMRFTNQYAARIVIATPDTTMWEFRSLR